MARKEISSWKYSNIQTVTSVNFHPPDRVQVRENKDWVMHVFFKKFAKKKKKIRHLVGNWKKSGPHTQNHVSKISRLRVTGQKPLSKKGPKSVIIRQKKLVRLRFRWYQRSNSILNGGGSTTGTGIHLRKVSDNERNLGDYFHSVWLKEW